MRLSDYVNLAARDIRRQPIRSGLTVLALAISTVILVTLLAISLGAKQTIIRELGLNSALEEVIVTPNQNVGASFLGGNVQVANEATATLDEAAVSRLAALPPVRSADPRVALYELRTFQLQDQPDGGATGTGAAKKFVAQASGITTSQPGLVPLSAGRLFDGNSAERQVVLGASYAEELGYQGKPSGLVGRTVAITTQEGYRGAGATIPSPRASRQQAEDFGRSTTLLTATIVGVTDSGSNANQLLLPMAWARQIRTVQSYNAAGVLTGSDQLERTGYSSIVVRAKDVASVRGLTDSLRTAGYGFVSTQQQIDRITGLTTIMWGVLGSISLISLITACLGIVNTMLMTISEQRYAIGVWRAVGARRSAIAGRFIVQAALLGLIGGLLGACAGYGVSYYANRYISQLLAAQNLPAVNVVQLTPELLVASVLATVVFGIVSGLYPALRAAREDPSRALTAQ